MSIDAKCAKCGVEININSAIAGEYCARCGPEAVFAAAKGGGKDAALMEAVLKAATNRDEPVDYEPPAPSPLIPSPYDDGDVVHVGHVPPAFPKKKGHK